LCCYTCFRVRLFTFNAHPDTHPPNRTSREHTLNLPLQD
jgi:hypothetical protein